MVTIYDPILGKLRTLDVTKYDGIALVATATPAHVANKQYLCGEAGTIFGIALCKAGDTLYDNGSTFIKVNTADNPTDYKTFNNLTTDTTSTPTSGKAITYIVGGRTYRKDDAGKVSLMISDQGFSNAERPGLTFDGTTQYLQHPAISIPNGQPWTWIGHINWSGNGTDFIFARGRFATNSQIIAFKTDSSNTFAFKSLNNTTYKFSVGSSTDIINTRSVVIIMADGLGNINLVKNGKIVETIACPDTSIVFEGIGRVWSSAAYLIAGSLYDDLLFNCTLSATELMDAYIGLMTGRYEIPFKYRGGNQVNLIVDSGFNDASKWGVIGATSINTGAATIPTNSQLYQANILTIGKTYTFEYDITSTTGGLWSDTFNAFIPIIIGHNKFTGVAKIKNVHLFSTTGNSTTIDNWTCVEVGCLAEFRGANANSISWRDTSGNGYHAASIATPQVIVPQPQVEAIKTSITGDTVLTGFVPINYRREHMRIVNKTANAVVLNLGTTAGGTDILFDVYLAGNDYVDIDLSGMTVSTAFTMYLSSKAWNSSNLSIVVVSKQGVAL